MKLKFEVRIFSDKYIGTLKDAENLFYKIQRIPRIGETIFSSDVAKQKAMDIAISKKKDDGENESITIKAKLDALVFTVTGIGYSTDSELITVHVQPDDQKYKRIDKRE